MGWVKDTSVKAWRMIRKLSSKETALFLFFVCMASGFWLLLAFNNNMTHDIIVNVKTQKPTNVTFIQEPPATITVTIKDRGLFFLKSFFRSTPSIEINFERYSDEKNNTLEVSSSQLMSEVRKAISRETSIIKIHPETIKVQYTTIEGKKVPINWEDNITNFVPDKQFVVNPDMVTTSPDSVMVYAMDRSTLHSISEVDIITVEVDNLTKTYTRTIKLKPIKDVRIIPDHIKLTVPVEPLIRKEQDVPISVRNQPSGVNILTFPPSVHVSYLLPQSKYKEPANLTVVVDYDDIDPSTNKVNIKVGEVSGAYSDVVLSVDSVNYVIERY